VFAQYSFIPLKLKPTATSLAQVAFLLFWSLGTTPRYSFPGADTSSWADHTLDTSSEKALSLTFIEYIFNYLMTLCYKMSSIPRTSSPDLTVTFMGIFN